MVIGRGQELDQDLAYYTHLRLDHILVYRYGVEVPDYLINKVGEASSSGLHATDGSAFPFLMHLVDGTRNPLIRSGPVNHAHEEIAQGYGLHSALDGLKVDLEARVGLKALDGECNNGYLRVARLLQSTADEAYIVCGTAASACLSHDESELVHIILAGLDRMHHLADDYHGRVAGVVIYILDTGVCGYPVYIGKHLYIQVQVLKCSAQDREMNR